MSSTLPTSGMDNAKVWLTLLVAIASPILGVVLGYGSYTATNSSKEQRLINLENKIVEQQKQLDYFRDNYPPRTEIKPQLDAMRDTLNRIDNNVSERRGR